jgi:hypothetical protein
MKPLSYNKSSKHEPKTTDTSTLAQKVCPRVPISGVSFEVVFAGELLPTRTDEGLDPLVHTVNVPCKFLAPLERLMVPRTVEMGAREGSRFASLRVFPERMRAR